MNLVAKEYVAAQDPDDPGVLVLSGLPARRSELTEALIVNPFDSMRSPTRCTGRSPCRSTSGKAAGKP